MRHLELMPMDLAVPYSLTIALGHDSSGDIIGVNGDFPGPLNILQNFFQSGVRDRAKINSCFTAQEFWLLARRERRAYPASGSVRSEQRSQRAKGPAGKCEVIFARSLTRDSGYDSGTVGVN